MLISPPRCDQDATLVSQFQDYLVRGTFTDISVSILQKNLKYSIRYDLSFASISPMFWLNFYMDKSVNQSSNSLTHFQRIIVQYTVHDVSLLYSNVLLHKGETTMYGV